MLTGLCVKYILLAQRFGHGPDMIEYNLLIKLSYLILIHTTN